MQLSPLKSLLQYVLYFNQHIITPGSNFDLCIFLQTGNNAGQRSDKSLTRRAEAKNKTKQNKTKQNKTKQNKTKQNKTKQNKTKQKKTTNNKQTKSGGLVKSLRCYIFKTVRSLQLIFFLCVHSTDR